MIEGVNDMAANCSRTVKALTEPGELVVDPFGGGFTTAACCLRLDLRCVSCDVVEQVVSVGKCRLKQVWDEMEAAKRS